MSDKPASNKPETTAATEEAAKPVTMAKYNAPPHTTQVHLTCGRFDVVDGVVEVPAEVSQGDIAGLAVHGFTPA